MSLALGNGITATWTPNGGTLVTFGVTGFSWSGGDRPEIDVTIGTSNRRETYIGLASPEEYTLSVKYNSSDAALTSSMEICGAGALIVKMAPDDDCGTIEVLLTMTDADLVSFNYAVALDGILEGEATFRRRH